VIRARKKYVGLMVKVFSILLIAGIWKIMVFPELMPLMFGEQWEVLSGASTDSTEEFLLGVMERLPLVLFFFMEVEFLGALMFLAITTVIAFNYGHTLHHLVFEQGINESVQAYEISVDREITTSEYEVIKASHSLAYNDEAPWMPFSIVTRKYISAHKGSRQEKHSR
jgi:hypothetical protein